MSQTTNPPNASPPDLPAEIAEETVSDMEASGKNLDASDVDAAEEGVAADETADPCTDCDKDTFEIIIGAHLAREDDWIGHATITLDVPTEACKIKKRITRGFWPAGVANFADPKLYSSGVPGKVADDGAAGYYPGPEAGHPFFAFKTFRITCAQAKAAYKVIADRQVNPGKYSALMRQCSTFAMDVLNAAGQDIDAGTPQRPGVIYNAITGKDLPAGHKMTPVRQLSEIGYNRAAEAAERAMEHVGNVADDMLDKL